MSGPPFVFGHIRWPAPPGRAGIDVDTATFSCVGQLEIWGYSNVRIEEAIPHRSGEAESAARLLARELLVHGDGLEGVLARHGRAAFVHVHGLSSDPQPA